MPKLEPDAPADDTSLQEIAFEEYITSEPIASTLKLLKASAPLQVRISDLETIIKNAFMHGLLKGTHMAFAEARAAIRPK